MGILGLLDPFFRLAISLFVLKYIIEWAKEAWDSFKQGGLKSILDEGVKLAVGIAVLYILYSMTLSEIIAPFVTIFQIAWSFVTTKLLPLLQSEVQ